MNANHSSRQAYETTAPATYLLALVLSFSTTGALIMLSMLDGISKTTFALIFLLPVGMSATFWGLGPGITAAFGSFFAFNYYFIEPRHTLIVHSNEDLVILVAFLFVAIVISELAARIKRNLQAAQTHEREALQMYELSITLANLSDREKIISTLIDRVIDTLQADRVEISIETTPEPYFRARGMIFTRKPDLLTPLQSSNRLMGELRIWRETGRITEREKRLVSAFTSQGVLAIEREKLSDDARKTRVLEESDQLKSSLLSSVSHELRSPLAAIKASVSSLRSGTVEWESEARSELLAMVEEEIDHLNVLVGNLLDMSRIESGSLKPEKKPNLLSEIVGAAVRRVRQQAQNHHITVDVSDELPLARVDFIQMEQVFINLLSNSIKYSPPGSIISITVHAKDTKNFQASIINQSMPVPETDLGRIFDKFYRINPSEKVTGSGLGLSICKGIIEAHGGKIWAENVPNGVAFKFVIPI